MSPDQSPQQIDRRWRFVVALAAFVVIAGGTGSVVWARAGLPEDAVLEVAGEVVTEAELRKEVATLKALYGIEPPRGKKLEAFWQDAAQATAVSRILDAAARERDIAVAGTKVDQALASYVHALYEGAADRDTRFTAALGNAGTSLAAVRAEIRRRLVVDALAADVVKPVDKPSSEEVRDAFEERRCVLELPETRRLRNIVVATRLQADDLVRELRAGADFAELARTRSADASTREQGGDLGAISISQLEEAYGRMAFGAEPGTIFGPVQTASGWNVGEVTQVVPGRQLDYAEVAGRLAEHVLLERQSAVWHRWLKKEIKEADVAYADEYRPKRPHAVPAGISAWADATQGGCTDERESR